jgi:hypothetical protein
MMEAILKFLALLSAGIFTGSAFYLTTVEHPARMSLGVEDALQQFRSSAVVPFTLLFIMPTNRLLLDEADELEIELERARLAKWARLHAMRTVLSLLGFLVLVWECVALR